MRISILGNSDTTGMFLAPGTSTWPVLLQECLRDTFPEPVEVDSWRFAPYRPRALQHALALVSAAEPDLVVVPLASYWCVFGTVRARVEQRFGARAAVFYARGERAISRHVEGGVRPGKPRATLARRLARRVVGTTTLMSLPEFVGVYGTLIRELALREEMQVLVLGDHHYNARTQRMLPRAGALIVEIERAIRPLVEERKLLWADLEHAISAGDRRDEMILSDGVHMSPEAHQRVAKALLPIVEAFARTQ